MSTNFLSNVSFITTGFLNSVNDATAGGPVSSGTGALLREGQLGAVIALSNTDAVDRSVTATGTLRGGLYQYVRCKASTTEANNVGVSCFWDTNANSGIQTYVVTPDSTATNLTAWAGAELNNVGKGNYGWIQVAGLCRLGYIASVTSTTIGSLVFSDVTPTNLVDANVEASVTIRQYSKHIGYAYAAPANSTTALVMITRTALTV